MKYDGTNVKATGAMWNQSVSGLHCNRVPKHVVQMDLKHLHLNLKLQNLNSKELLATCQPRTCCVS